MNGHALETRIGILLRTGVAVSVTLIAAGTAVSFLHHPDYVTSGAALTRLTEPGQAPSSLGEIARGLWAFRGQAWVMLGILVLMVTPILRVAISLVAFARSKDRAFTALTAAVLALLLLSLALGRAG